MKNKEKTVKVSIPRVSGKEDTVFVSVGDRSWRIMRGTEVEIPESAYEVLRNSELAADYARAYIASKH